jgi:hypothetical protein
LTATPEDEGEGLPNIAASGQQISVYVGLPLSANVVHSMFVSPSVLNLWPSGRNRSALPPIFMSTDTERMFVGAATAVPGVDSRPN